MSLMLPRPRAGDHARNDFCSNGMSYWPTHWHATSRLLNQVGFSVHIHFVGTMCMISPCQRLHNASARGISRKQLDLLFRVSHSSSMDGKNCIFCLCELSSFIVNGSSSFLSSPTGAVEVSHGEGSVLMILSCKFDEVGTDQAPAPPCRRRWHPRLSGAGLGVPQARFEARVGVLPPDRFRVHGRQLHGRRGGGDARQLSTVLLGGRQHQVEKLAAERVDALVIEPEVALCNPVPCPECRSTWSCSRWGWSGGQRGPMCASRPSWPVTFSCTRHGGIK